MWHGSLSNHWRPALEQRLFLSSLSARKRCTVSGLVRGGRQPVHAVEWTAHRVPVVGPGRQELLRHVRDTPRLPTRGRPEHDRTHDGDTRRTAALPAQPRDLAFAEGFVGGVGLNNSALFGGKSESATCRRLTPRRQRWSISSHLKAVVSVARYAISPPQRLFVSSFATARCVANIPGRRRWLLSTSRSSPSSGSEVNRNDIDHRNMPSAAFA